MKPRIAAGGISCVDALVSKSQAPPTRINGSPSRVGQAFSLPDFCRRLLDILARGPRRRERGSVRWRPMAAIAAVIAIALAALATGKWSRPTIAPGNLTRVTLTLPDDAKETSTPAAPTFVPSPDGRTIAFAAVDARTNRDYLWVRAIGAIAARHLDKTDGANFPFWSPDSKNVGFFAEHSLRRVDVGTGVVQTICELPGPIVNRSANGAAWSPAGVVIFQIRGALLRVPASGGTPEPATQLDEASRENRQSWPQFLPDGKHFLYLSQHDDPLLNGIAVQELGSKKRAVPVMRTMTRAQFASPGFLVFHGEGALWAQRFDPGSLKLSGEPAVLARELTANDTLGRAAFAVSDNGVLIYRSGGTDPRRQLVWFDRGGARLGSIGKPGFYSNFRLSPDEKSVNVTGFGNRASPNTWIVNLADGAMQRASVDTGQAGSGAAWSPDGKRIVYSRATGGMVQLILAEGAASPVPGSDKMGPVWDWSPDGRLLIAGTGAALKIFVAPLAGQPRQVLDDASVRRDFRISPDGKKVAFADTDTGRAEVYVASFPAFDQKRRVSIAGGVHPEWSRDSRELFYVAPDGMLMAVPMRESGDPVALFAIHTGAIGGQFAPLSDGKRFLVLENTGRSDPAQITLVTNWTAAMK